jgi:hypothetical protein
MNNRNKEPACYWSAELICAGHYTELWDTIIYFVGKYINIVNPKIIIYIDRRYKVFKNIISQDIFYNELDLRNYNNIRSLFGEIISVLTLSVRKQSIEGIKIKRNEEFEIRNMSERLEAPSMDYIKGIFRERDCEWMYIPLNELGYQVSDDGNDINKGWYWIEWIMEMEKYSQMRDRKIKNEEKEESGTLHSGELSIAYHMSKVRQFTKCICDKMENKVEEKYKKEIIWLVWEVLIKYGEKRNDEYINEIMNSLKSIFSIKYNRTTNKKRKYLLYNGVLIIKEGIKDRELIEKKDREKLTMVVENINEIYRQIKKSEQSPNTEYLLFQGFDGDKT